MNKRKQRAPVTAIIIFAVTTIQRKTGTIIRWQGEKRYFRRDLGRAKARQLSLLLLQNLVKDLCERGSTTQCALSLRSYLTLCDLMDRSSPGSSVHEVLQARILEWFAISFSSHSTDEKINLALWSVHLTLILSHTRSL